VGCNVKDGGKWAMLSMESKAAGEAVIGELHLRSLLLTLLSVLEQLREVKGREITVKWKEEGMWTCPDPTCAKSNFDEREECVQCKLPKSKFVKKKL
jgi:hypothetical protein